LGNFFDQTIALFDFDQATGVVSNPVTWDWEFPNSLIYGVEFSPDGSKLYASNLERVIQYDINQATPAGIQATAFEVSQNLSNYQPATLQLGPDNKIYIAAGSIDAINAPNNSGAACAFTQNAVPINGITNYGLPQWIYYIDQSAQPNEMVVLDTCLIDTTQFTLQNPNGITSVTWNFGDPSTGANNTASSLNPSHIFSQSGAFSVQAIVDSDCGLDTITQSLNIVNCDCNVYVPNAFTPGGDDTNDEFYPIANCPFNQFTCSIFSRWGELLYQTNNPVDKWNGKYQGNDCPIDVYVYLITYQIGTNPLKTVAGNITLLR